jgi:outer membrane protein OmpA-like peptidoglycan-associated protein
MNRSFAVSSALMKEGVSPDSIKTVSWGSARATGNDEQDRRVDISMGER